MRTIAFLPLRAGSKGIPGKNKKDFCGKPLFEWAILSLLLSQMFDTIWVSTDDNEIKQFLKGKYPNSVMVHHRSKEVSSDTASTEDVIFEFIENLKVVDDTIFVLVQATHPFVQSFDYQRALLLYSSEIKKVPNTSVLSVSETHRFFWRANQPINYDPMNRKRRQDFEQSVFVENGGFYISTVGNIKKYKNRLTNNRVLYKMPEWTQQEIDTLLDWGICETIFGEHVLNGKNSISSV